MSHGGNDFFDNAVRSTTDAVKIVATIFKGRLDEKDPRFKELVSDNMI